MTEPADRAAAETAVVRATRSVPEGFRVRCLELTDEDLAAYVSMRATVTPENVPDAADVRWSDAQYPGGAHVVVEDRDGALVAAATVGRIYMYDASYDAFFAGVYVLPFVRRRGIGSALLAACSAVARAAGKVALVAEANDARPEGIAFLEHRGFSILERFKTVRLDLAGLAPSSATPPPGISLVTLAERPDLVPAIHAVAVETFADIPGQEPVSVGDLDEFRARDVERPGIDHEAFIVAMDGERAVGYASLVIEAGRPGIAYHDMTAVVRSHRGRGIATALKRATIGWAIRAGLTALETGNDEANAPMRAVNARLGYRPLPDWLLMRGPLSDGIMTP